MDTWHANLGGAIRKFAALMTEAKPDLDRLQTAELHLNAAAYSIEAGETSQGALRMFLACQDLYAAVNEVERNHELQDEISEALAHELTVYLDTNIISAMAKLDLPQDELAALEKVLDVYQAGLLGLYTSDLAKQELDCIPEQFRQNHVRLFRLIRLVAGEPENTPPISEGLQLRATRLQTCLSVNDFNHLMQAVSGGAEIFLTLDSGVRSQKALAGELEIAVLSPRELESELRRRHLMGSSHLSVLESES